MNADRHRSIPNLRFQICVYLCLAVVPSLVGCQQMEKAGDFAKRLGDFMTGNTPIAAAKTMEDQYFPDERRTGIVKLSNDPGGRTPLYTERYRQIAQFDSDWLVRATAIRALNRSRDASATPIFIKALADQNEIVRVEACKALGNLPDPNAAQPLTRLVGNPEEPRDVRIWAAHALRHYQNLDVARILANQLRGRDFSVAWQARKSLVSLTGKDMQYDEPAWLQYLSSTERPFVG